MPPATSRLLRRMNAQRVLDALREVGAARVTEIVERTGLSRPTVDAVADELIRLGWLEEIAAEAAGRGRPARLLAFRPDAGYVAGVDIGEHRVRTAIADLRGDIVGEDEREVIAGGAAGFVAGDAPGGGDAGAGAVSAADPRGTRGLVAAVRASAARALKLAGARRDDLLAACVGCTGPMDPETGRVIFSSVFESGFDLAGALRRTLGRRVVVENDCNLAVIGDRWRGVSAGMDDVICVLASERMGAGILVGGRLVRGHAGAAGELAFLGAYNVEHGAEGIASLVRRLSGEDPHDVFDAARAGDPVALGVVERAIDGAGRAIGTLALVLNPELVVIGGGVAEAGDVLLDPLRRRLAEMARLPPRVEVSPLAARVVIVGAIRRALDDLEPRLLDGLEDAA